MLGESTQVYSGHHKKKVIVIIFLKPNLVVDQGQNLDHWSRGLTTQVDMDPHANKNSYYHSLKANSRVDLQ
jgi:hypothetical protein